MASSCAAERDLLRRDFGERQQYKGPLVNARMRHCQALVLNELVSVEQQIQIQRARRIAIRTLTPSRLLYGLQRIEQRQRRGLVTNCAAALR